MKKQRCCVSGLILTTIVLMSSLLSGIARSQQADVIDTILADGQFVYGPNVGEFDIGEFLISTGSPLFPYSTMLEDKARYFSINPRLLLTILEVRSGLVVGHDPIANVDNAVGYEDIAGLNDQVEALNSTLVLAFYSHLYGESQHADSQVELVLRTGEQVRIPADTNAGTLAVLVTLAPLLSPDQWQTLVSSQNTEGFIQTYRHLFPESDPLDNTNQLIAPTAPPADLLKLPFACGDTWNFSGGPHDWDGNCVDHPWSAVDFAPGVPYCTIPTDRWITSPAGGNVSDVSCGGCQVYINHSGNWGTRFYHVANTQVGEGQTVAQDQHIGNPSCKPAQGGSCGGCSGNATGTHVHYDLMYNGAFYAISGTSLEGWTVHATTCYNGYLEKNGQQVWKGSPVTSETCPGNCCCSKKSRRGESEMPASSTSPSFPGAFAWAAAEATNTASKIDPSLVMIRTPQPTSAPTPGRRERVLAPTPIPTRRAEIEPQRTPPASASYRISKSVLGSGGGEKTSAHYVMNSTQGQSTDLSHRQSASYVLLPGYWGPAMRGNYRVHLPLVLKSY